MAAETELHRVAPDLLIWHRYDPAVKADLFSTALGTGAGVFLIDPITPAPNDLPQLLAGVAVDGVLITNANHARGAAEFARQFAAPIYARRGAHSELGLPHCLPLKTAKLPGSLTALPIDGAAAGEMALHCTAQGGTLVLGDALINVNSHGFAFLPAKYCADQKRMRDSLRVLLDYDFTRILFAHGAPIVTRARERLTDLLLAR
ncbi:MAG: hypothetical protein ACR2ID_09450 [Chthoniobacterales bacterium]